MSAYQKGTCYLCIIVDLKPSLLHLQSYLQCSLVQYVPICFGTYAKHHTQRLFGLESLSHLLLLLQQYQSSDHQLQHIVLNQAHVFAALSSMPVLGLRIHNHHRVYEDIHKYHQNRSLLILVQNRLQLLFHLQSQVDL